MSAEKIRRATDFLIMHSNPEIIVCSCLSSEEVKHILKEEYLVQNPECLDVIPCGLRRNHYHFRFIEDENELL